MYGFLLFLCFQSLPSFLENLEPIRVWEWRSGKTLEAQWDVSRDSDPDKISLTTDGEPVVVLLRDLSQEDKQYVLRRREKRNLQKEYEIPDGKKPGERLTRTLGDVEFAFRWCPPGTFLIGSPTSEKGRWYNETQHSVTLTKGFWMMETEVTQAQWNAVMGRSFQDEILRYDAVQRALQIGNTDQVFARIAPENPVHYLSWHACRKFCEQARRQGLPLCLPTEAQWEYACRAGTTGKFAGDLDAMAWFESNSQEKIYPVGILQPNAWGLYDMHGNISEWCADYFAFFSPENVTDPQGPKNGKYRVFRGSHWTSNRAHSRSAKRSAESPSANVSTIGMRCILGQ
ncbi:MAG: formylglycine-generating enzyme family protein [Planctomycetia bacterium]|nr:formylglycine-generating enzyme family protein [Planctomycetia bacterium]